MKKLNYLFYLGNAVVSHTDVCISMLVLFFS